MRTHESKLPFWSADMVEDGDEIPADTTVDQGVHVVVMPFFTDKVERGIERGKARASVGYTERGL